MTEVYVRKMASIQVVNGVYPIEGADKICQYGIQGWRVVDQVGKYNVGDLVVFAEVDSFIPSTVAPFLTKPGHYPKTYQGVEGEKLRTIRLRKQLSQGLLLPLSVLDHVESELFEGLDVSFPLGIVKWEPPPEFTSADAKGNFPSFIIKTDQERVQSAFGEVSTHFDQSFEISEKIEGSSMTVYHRDGEFGCCSRNLDLKRSDENTYWKMAVQSDLENKLKALGKNIAIQGELCGPKICGNIYGHDVFYWFVFDVFDIDTFSYYTPAERRALTKELGLVDVPVLKTEASLAGETCESLLTMADGYSVLGTTNTRREGLVFKANTADRLSFKAVSNLYLEKVKD
jgi:RNA ligase (TIGR02306 family)